MIPLAIVILAIAQGLSLLGLVLLALHVRRLRNDFLAADMARAFGDVSWR